MAGQKGYIASLTCATLFGLGTVLTKKVISDVHPLTVTVIVYLTAGMTLAMVGVWTKRKQKHSNTKLPRASKIDLKVLALSIFLGVVVAPVIFFYGMKHTTAVNTSFLINTEVLITVALAYLFLKERASIKDYLAIVLLLAAVVIVTTNLQLSSLSLGGYMFGNTLVVLGCLFWSIDNNLSKVLAIKHDISQVVYLKSLIGGLLVLLIAAFLGISMSVTMETLLHLITVGVLAYGIGIYCFYYSLRHIGAMKSISIFSTQAIFGIFFAFVLLGEGLSYSHLIGGAVMFAGVWLLQMQKEEKTGV